MRCWWHSTAVVLGVKSVLSISKELAIYWHYLGGLQLYKGSARYAFASRYLAAAWNAPPAASKARLQVLAAVNVTCYCTHLSGSL